jgi:hypothetical protein
MVAHVIKGHLYLTFSKVDDEDGGEDLTLSFLNTSTIGNIIIVFCKLKTYQDPYILILDLDGQTNIKQMSFNSNNFTQSYQKLTFHQEQDIIT